MAAVRRLRRAAAARPPVTPTGRADAEVTSFHGVRAAPEGTRALNYAFDITPADLVTAIVTEDRVIRP